MPALNKQLENVANNPNVAQIPQEDQPQPGLDTAMLDQFVAQQAAPQPQAPEAAVAPAIDTTLLDQFLAQPETVSSNPNISKTESFARGSSQGATFGLGDELSGMFETTLGTMEAMLRGKNAFGDEGRIEAIQNIVENYRRSRDTIRQQNAEAQTANPGAFLGGELVGMGVTAPATGAAIRGVMGATKAAQVAITAKRAGDVAKRATEVSNVTRAVARTGALGSEAVDAVSKTSKVIQGVKTAAKVGATEGAIMGFGNSEADLTKGEVGEAALDTAMGAAAGGVLGGTISLAGKGISAGIAKAAETEIFKKVRDVASQYAEKHIENISDLAGNFALRVVKGSGAGIREVRRLYNLDKIAKFGEDLLNDQVTPIGGQPIKKAIGFKTLSKTRDIISENLTKVNDEADNFVRAYDQASVEAVKRGMKQEAADDLFKVNVQETAQKMRAWVRSEFTSSAQKGVKNEMLGAVDNFEKFYPQKKISLSQAIDERKGFQTRVDYFKQLGTQSPQHEKAYAKFARLMNETIDTKASSVLKRIDPKKEMAYKRVRELQSNFADALRITDDALIRKQSNNVLSLTESLVGIGAGSAIGSETGIGGGSLGGLATAMAFRGARKAVPRIGAKAANTIVKGLRKAGKVELGKFYPAMKAAQERGVPAVLATHLLLYSTSADYRDQIEQLDDVE